GPDAAAPGGPVRGARPRRLHARQLDPRLRRAGPGRVRPGLRPGPAAGRPGELAGHAHLGRPLPGAALLGGFAALTWAVSLDSVLAAINERVAEGNATAARAAFDFVRDERE